MRVLFDRTAVTVLVLIVDDSLEHADAIRSLSTTTPSVHGASLLACRGHQGKQSRSGLVDIMPVTAALLLTSALRRRVRGFVEAPSMTRSNSFASDLGM